MLSKKGRLQYLFSSRNTFFKQREAFYGLSVLEKWLIRPLKKERATLLLVYNVVREKAGCYVLVWIFNAVIRSRAEKERFGMFILEKNYRPGNGFTIHGEVKEFNSVYSLIIKPSIRSL